MDESNYPTLMHVENTKRFKAERCAPCLIKNSIEGIDFE